jgi:hypothetical protein
MTETIEGLASNPISRRGAMLGFGAGASLAAMPWRAGGERNNSHRLPRAAHGPFRRGS